MKQTVLCLFGIGVFLGFSHNLYAQMPRDQVIAHLTEQYGTNKAIQLYEEMQVREAVEAFARRVNFRDIKSLTGLLDEDLAQRGTEGDKSSPSATVASEEHRGSPQKREFITTVSRDYTVEERKTLRSDLLDLFLKLPPNVRFDFKIQRLMVTGHSASVEVTLAFKVREIETPKTRTLSARTPTSLVLQLDKVEDRWLVTNLKNVTTRIASTVVN